MKPVTEETAKETIGGNSPEWKPPERNGFIDMRNKRIPRLLIIGALAMSAPGRSYALQVADASAAQAPGGPAMETPAAGVNPEGLYRNLSLDRRVFEEGIRLTKEGRRDEGARMTATAQDRLFSGLRQCMSIKGCNIEVYFDALSDLSALQLAALEENPEAADGSQPEEPEASESAVEIPVPETAFPEPPRSHTLLPGKDLREIIELNEPIKAAMNDWLTWLRPQLMDSYENYHFLRDAIAPVYEEAGLPEALLFALIATETGGKVHAVSSSGATGLMQFMGATGKYYGLTVRDGFDLRLDPVAATRANVAFLKEQLEVLNRDLEKALAAYNGGQNRLRRLNRDLKGISFWDIRFFSSLPAETRTYVPRILAAAWLYLHPQDYGLKFGSFPKETAMLELKRDTALDQLSICLGQEEQQRNGWFRTLRNLNPKLEHQEILKAGEKIVIPAILKNAYGQRCLDGALFGRAVELHEARFPEIIMHTVAKGETLTKIAERYRCSVKEISAVNNLRGPEYRLQPGQKLKIPGRR